MRNHRLDWSILLFALFISSLAMSIEHASAHRGHEGPSKVFMKESEAVRTMLPQDGKILKRKEVLKKENHADALKKWGYAPAEGIYTYYISKEDDGGLLGALFLQTIDYKHGNIVIGVAYNSSSSISDIKLLSCSEKYLIEVRKELLDSGYLNSFLQRDADEIVSEIEDYDKNKKDDLRYLTVKEIEKTSMLLKIFQGF